MANRNNLILTLIVVVALIAVLAASGAGAILWQWGTNLVEALVAFLLALLPK